MCEKAILPCPAYGSEVEMQDIDISGNKHAYLIACSNNKCRCFRVGSTEQDQCVRRWNAVPRILKWSKDAPEKSGWYWIQRKERTYVCYIANGIVHDSGTAIHIHLLKDAMFAGPLIKPEGNKNEYS